jgi:hypothetical protein
MSEVVYKVGDRVTAVNCDWDGDGTVVEVYEHNRRKTYDVRWDDEGIVGSHTAQWLRPSRSKEAVYVIRLGSFAGDGPYLVARDDEDWTISFTQKRAKRFYNVGRADAFASEFGDARPVRLRSAPRTSPRGAVSGCVVHAGAMAIGCRDCDRAIKGRRPVFPDDIPPGVASFIGYAAMRGISLPMDFCQWLAAAPRPLDCEQCIALYVCLRAIETAPPPSGGGGSDG